jgi:hypothetical protein
MFSPAALRVLGIVPLPNQPGLTENFFASSKQQLAPETISRKRQWRSFPMKARGYARQELNHHRMLKQLSNKSPSRMPPQPFMILRYTTNKSESISEA